MKNILRKSNFRFKNRIMRMALLRSEPRKLNRSFGGLRASLLLALTAGWMGAAQVQAQTRILAWDFTGESNNVSSIADIVDSSLDSTNTLIRGPGAAASSAGNSFRTTGFQNNGISTTNTDYFQFSLSARNGKTLSLNSISARFGGTASFVTNNSNAGAANQFAFSTNGSTWTLIGSPTVVTGSNNANWTMTVALSNIVTLQNLPSDTTAILRFYASGQTTTGGYGFISSSNGVYGLDVAGTLTDLALPSITLSTNSLALISTFTDAASTPVSYTVSGTNLGGTNIVITPSSSLVQVSTNDSSGFSTNAINLQPIAGVVSSTTIFARIAASSTATNNFSASISHVSGSASTNLAVSGTINQAGQPPVITATNFSGQVNVAFSQTIQASGSPTNFTLVSGTLPGGLTFNSNNGTITGTPTNATVGTNNLTVTAANTNGTSSNSIIGLAIAKGDQAINGIAASNSKLTTDAPFTLPLNTSAGFPIFYSSLDNNVATVTGNTVTLVGAGSTVILAQRDGDNDWNAAPAVSQNLTVTVPPLTLTVNSAMTAFNVPFGSSSASQTFSLVGVSLSNDVVVTPPAGFEISSDGSSFGTNSLTLSKGGGNISNTISVRLPTNAPGGLLGGSILAVTDSNGTSVTRSTTVRGAVGVYWDFTSASPATNAVPQDWTLGPLTQGNNNGGAVALITNISASSGYTGASLTSNAGVAAQTGVFNPSNSAYFEIPIVVPDGDTNTLTDYGVRQVVFGSRSTPTGPVNYTIRSSADNYQSDIAMGSMPNDNSWGARSNANVNLLLSKGTNTIRIYGYGSSAASQSGGSANWRIDDLVVTLGSIVNTNPTLSLLPSSITGLKAFTGSPSPSANYVVKGANLATNLNLQVSTNAIQISTDNTTFTNQLTLTPTTNGVLSNTVYVRLSSEAALGPVTGTVQNVSGSLTNTLSVAGTVYDAARGGSAATLAGWDVNDQIGGTGNFGPSPLAPTIKNSDVVVGGMTRGTGVVTSSTGAARAWGGTTWEDANSVDAIDNGKFVTFTLQATSGKTLSLTSLPKFNYRAATSFGPTRGLIQYQVGSGAFQNVTEEVTYTANGNGQTLSPLNLSGIQDLQNVPASQQITFRIVNWGGQTNPNPAFPGSWYIFDTAVTPDIDFEVTGSVADALPAPTGLSYTTSSVNATALTPIASLSPTLTTGSEITYSIDPSLPDGLVINPLTGVISGTPSAAAASAIYTVKASNAGGNTTTTLTIVVDAVPADTTAPVITLTGQASMTVAWGASYTDAGATATDNVDSSVTVTPSGSVNTAVPGTYTITYNARDAASNNATPVTRTVTVYAPSSEVGADGLSGLLRYAFGANGPSDTVTKPTSTLSAGKLAITAIVRTNNPNLTVVGQAVTNLPNYASGTSIVGADVAADADQTNVTNGCERQVFSVDQGTDAKKFLRLKATLNNP